MSLMSPYKIPMVILSVVTYLYHQILQQFLVSIFVVVDLFSDLGFEVYSELVGDVIDFSHSLDSHRVLLLGLVNFHFDLIIGQHGFVVFSNLLFLFVHI